jgi:anti-sigma regulatory factor (Ser/Thr protein kinase)
MGKITDRLRFWPRASAPAWRTRVERERSAIGRFNETVEQKLVGQVPAKVVHDLQVVFDELLTNVVMHAQQAAGPIEIELQHDRYRVTATIRYLADEFDPTTWREESLSMTVAASRIGGLGIALVRRLMDEFRYEYVDGHNVLKLVKRC